MLVCKIVQNFFLQFDKFYLYISGRTLKSKHAVYKYTYNVHKNIHFPLLFLFGKSFTTSNVNIHLCEIIYKTRIISVFLCNCIYFFSIQLNNEKLNKIADHIITLFPAECKEVYYCPPMKSKDSKNHKSGIAKGKLVDKNRNMLAFLRKYQLIPLSKSVPTNSSKNENSFDKGWCK